MLFRSIKESKTIFTQIKRICRVKFISASKPQFIMGIWLLKGHDAADFASRICHAQACSSFILRVRMKGEYPNHQLGSQLNGDAMNDGRSLLNFQ